MLPAIFISYSGRGALDKRFAKLLLARLEEQQLDPWIYEKRGSEIPPQDHIEEHCRLKIRKADLFVAVISDSSLDSPFTIGEVLFAFQCHGGRGIFQIVTTAASNDTWPQPYRQLAPFKHVRVRPDVEEDLEPAIEDICSRMSVAYEPPTDAPANLPLVKRLTTELRDAKPDRPDYEVGLFSNLRSHALTISRDYRHRRFDRALQGVNSLVYLLGKEIPKHSFYYPVVVKGVLEAAIGRERPEFLSMAQRTFDELIAEHKPLGTCDENAIAGLAAVRLMRGDAVSAFRLYSEAHDWLVSQRRSDADLIHNLIIAGIAGNDPFAAAKAEALLDAIPHLIESKDPYLHDRLMLCRGLVYICMGDTAGAEGVLSTVDLAQPHLSDLAVRLAQELCEQAQILNSSRLAKLSERLLALLARDANPQTERTAVLALASLHSSRGEPRKAVELLKSLAQKSGVDAQLRVEMALCYRALGDRRQVQSLCMAATSSTLDELIILPLHRNIRRELYFRGFAHWLLGQEELARSDFRDAQFADAPWYGSLVHSPSHAYYALTT